MNLVWNLLVINLWLSCLFVCFKTVKFNNKCWHIFAELGNIKISGGTFFGEAVCVFSNHIHCQLN